MKLSTFLKTSLYLLFIKITLEVVGIFISTTQGDPLFYSLLNLCEKILQASAITILFIFMRKFERQKIYLLPIVLMVLISIYYGVTGFYTMPLIGGETSEIMRHQLLFTALPAAIYFIMITFFSIQLLKNHSLTQERNIKLIGMSYMILVYSLSVAILASYLFLLKDFKYLDLISELPSLAMINLYFSKLWEKEKPLPDIG
jgi:hypothetical protein